MRITGGSLRGRVLKVPVAPHVRPTSERAREALFNLIGQDLTGLRFLDAFAGTGAIAIEAASRGATVVAAERDRQAQKDLRARLDAVSVTGVELVPTDVLARAPALGRFDVVFADPPWDAPIEPILAALAPLTPLLVLESEDTTAVPDVAGPLVIDRRRTYGRTVFHVFRAPEPAPPATVGP